MTKKLVVVGNGMAPGRMLEHLFETAPGAYEVTIFNAEPRVNYDRIMLSPVLSGEKSFDDIVIHGDGWYVQHGVTLYKGHRIVAIDRAAKTVTSDAGVTAPYDHLVIATGSTPFVPPVPGHDLPGVLAYRDLDDVDAMILAAQSKAKAVVIGGGLLGLEAAVGLARLGVETTLLHVMDRLMERQLDHHAAGLVKRAMEARGVRVILKADTARIEGASRVERLVLADGTALPADLVVMSVGVRPSVALAQDAGLAVGRGITVDDRMTTSDPRIFALGECAEHRGQIYGLVEPAYEHAETLARHLAGEPAEYRGTALSTSLKVSGLPVFSAGIVDTPDDAEAIVLSDPGAGLYRKLLVRDGRLIGAVFVGDIAEQGACKGLIRSGAPIENVDDLMFGRPAPEPLAA